MNSYRNGDNFLGSDCLPVDCDNDHSENPADWVTPADVQAAFPGISFAVHYSRFHMREKNGKPARPKFHVLFPIEYMTDAAAYSEMKKLVNTIFPYFDTKALDAARFFFGTATPEVEMYPGEMTLSEYLSADDFDADLPGGSHGGTQVIPEGSRNATMSRFAGRVIKKYVFHADTEGLNFRRAFGDAGFYLSGCCIWKKQSLVLGRSPYQWQHEPVLYGWKKKGKHQWYTGRKESTIWEFDKPKKNGDHPTMKPIPLLAYPIMNSSMSNAMVLDPFGGSGSTLIACEQTDRICRTIELDEKFCDVIVKRYIEQVGSADGVSVQRDGLTYRYDEVAAESSMT